MFDDKDLKNLNNLMGLILEKMKLHDLDCMDISKTYNAFQWLQVLDGKIKIAIDNQDIIAQMNEGMQEREKQLLDHIQMLEDEIKDLQKPKKKTRKKKSK